MSRINRMQTGVVNPASKFITWSSKHDQFTYYDKEAKENVLIGVELKFLALARYKTVKGWNQKRQFSIISNEVKSLNDEIIVTAYPKSGEKFELCRGGWSDIRQTIDSNDGKYTESVYSMLPNGELVNIQLSGASLSTWFDFQKNQTNRFYDNWVVVRGFKNGVNGAVEFTYPVFEWGTSLNEEEQKLADLADAKIETYEESYFGKKEETQEEFRANSEVNKYNQKRDKIEATNNLYAVPDEVFPEANDDILF